MLLFFDKLKLHRKQSDLQKALQLDSYYATMVRGSCIKVPLTPDIWCAHDEMQHQGQDTTLFFSAMWDGLSMVAKQWHGNILRWTSSSSATTNASRNNESLDSILQVPTMFFSLSRHFFH